MIHQATERISEYFTMRGIKHRVEETGDMSEVTASFTGSHARGVVMRFISTNENNDVAVRINDLFCISVPESRHAAVREVLNRLNVRFRYLKFYLKGVEKRDDKTVNNGGIQVEYDLPIEAGEAVGPICREIFIRSMDIIDKACYPILAAIAGVPSINDPADTDTIPPVE